MDRPSGDREIAAIAKIEQLDLSRAVESLAGAAARASPGRLGREELRAGESLSDVLRLAEEGQEALLFNGGLPSVFWDELDGARKRFYGALDALDEKAVHVRARRAKARSVRRARAAGRPRVTPQAR